MKKRWTAYWTLVALTAGGLAVTVFLMAQTAVQETAVQERSTSSPAEAFKIKDESRTGGGDFWLDGGNGSDENLWIDRDGGFASYPLPDGLPKKLDTTGWEPHTCAYGNGGSSYCNYPRESCVVVNNMWTCEPIPPGRRGR